MAGKYYQIKIGQLTRNLPLFAVSKQIKIALFNLLGDTELVLVCAQSLSKKIPSSVQVLVTPEVKSIPLAYEVSKQLNIPFVVIRKIKKPYMKNCLSTQVTTITTGMPQTLWLDGKDRQLLFKKNVVLVDDVVSTGNTLTGLKKLMQKAQAKVIAEAAVFTEGDPKKWHHIISLGNLPIFTYA